MTNQEVEKALRANSEVFMWVLGILENELGFETPRELDDAVGDTLEVGLIKAS